jgi:hypothetical protein
MLVLFGDVSAQFAFVAFFLASLYLIFRISYRRIFANIHASLPSINTVKDVMRDLRGTPDKSEVKKSVKIDAIETSFKQKAQELEDQIRLLQKKRDKDAPNVSS